ncbi:cobyrinate a,c-diamide synthase [Chloroflexia bacterium SDU3-3]|nr:cobyrinate a,c-diamide synthase [Chloroflexia bacterium SDU3-3]
MQRTPMPRLVLAAAMSGSGKTTIAAGLIAALVRRGLAVAPFKCGPDYIDPSYHALAAGRPCANLDAWMLPPEQIAGILARRAHGADMAVVEGVMGLFDGYAGDDDTGSTAHIARLTSSPVVLVLDVRSMARTAAALVKGLRDFDPRLGVAGVILNRAGSQRHAAMVAQAIEGELGLPVLGQLLRDEQITLPERHLGLVPTAEDGRWQQWLDAMAERVTSSIDIDQLLQIARSAPPLAWRAPPQPAALGGPAPTIAVAADEAFSFRYPENEELLTAAGAQVRLFSPMRDAALPQGTSAIYLCGGFPELYAQQLAANAPMRQAIAAASQAGMPIYAECGGLMYLTEAVVDAEGRRFPMVGALQGRSEMTTRLTLGYRTLCAQRDSWLWRAGEAMRGHEFHYSTWGGAGQHPAPYQIQPDALRPQARAEGAQVGQTIASYVHLHFLAMPELATRFVRAAAQFQHR